VGKGDSTKELFPLKMRDAAQAAGFAYIKSKGLIPEEDSDDYLPVSGALVEVVVPGWHASWVGSFWLACCGAVVVVVWRVCLKWWCGVCVLREVRCVWRGACVRG
jgi:hypothetical protein